MKISKIRENARTALAGKWGKGVGIILAYLAFFFVVGLITGIFEGIFGEESLISNLIGIATAIIQVPIVFGMGYAFIKLKRSEDVGAFDFLDLGFSNFGRAWKISLRTLLKMVLPFILLVVSIVAITFSSLSLSIVAMEGSVSEPYMLLTVIGFILYIVAIIWLTVRTLLYALTTYIAFDNPNMSAIEVVNESARMMKGNRWKFFLLDLSFIGWAILAVFTLGIGYLWLLPYMQVAIVCFYEHLLGKNEVISNKEENVEAITEM